jgi:protoporphyrinogen oxidase
MFLRRPRLSRIYYRGVFFSYPPNFLSAVGGLGPIEGFRIALSYLKAQFFPIHPVVTFEHWVSNNFGKRLFSIFFKSYTEKVWGISCSELRAEWAAQRIKNMSLRTILRNMIVKTGRTVPSLIDEFNYPREGPGMMWHAAAELVHRQGGEVLVRAELTRLAHANGAILYAEAREGNCLLRIEAGAFISTMPLPELIAKLDPPPPPSVREAAARLRFRDFLTVCVIVDSVALFPDNWIYIHEPNVKVARIQNFKNWSPYMVPDATKTSLGLEYFCKRDDEIWNIADAELIKLAACELKAIGLIDDLSKVVDGCVFRVANAYPVYDEGYAAAVDIIRTFLHRFKNLRTVGRNGLHRYNNQDHSMLAGRFATMELLLGEQTNLWGINTEQDYHELKMVPGGAAPRTQSAPNLA